MAKPMIDVQKDILWRVYLVYFAILVFGLMVIGKIIFIQVEEGDRLKELANTQEIRSFNVKASRGNILANDGSLLATSVPVFEIRMDVASPNITDKEFYDHVEELAAGLSKVIGAKTKKGYKDLLIKSRRNGKRYVLLGKRVEYDELKELKTLPILKKGKHGGGLIAIQTPKRVFPFKELAARTIGYEIKKENLFVGLEGAYSDVLTGIDGKQVKRRINHGDWIPIHDENDIEPKDGLDILTTIDINIQDIAENALLRQLLNHKAYQGCAVVMEVNTGHIKAIANLKFDSTDSHYKEIYNYAIGESIEPGSTFKLANLLVALKDDKIRLTDSVFTREGFAVVNGMNIQDVHKIGNGRTTVREVFEESSNVGMALVMTKAYNHDPQKYIDGLYEMNLNEPLGIEIKGEGKPYIKKTGDPNIWWGTSLTAMSFGYELQQTPLQTLTYYNAIANKGRMVKPMFVTEVRMGDVTKERFGTEVINSQIVPARIVDTAHSLLTGVVKRGTGKNVFKNAPYEVAGKTGTAKIATNGQYQKVYNASFVGYFPADNPKYSCIVTVNRPTNGKYYGGSVAGPAFKEIADKIFATNLALEMEHETSFGEAEIPEKTSPSSYSYLKNIYAGLNIATDDYLYEDEWAKAEKLDEELVFESVEFESGKVPDVRGMKARDAIYLLENLGLETTINGRGHVRSQSIKAGSPVNKGNTIKLQLSVL